MSPPPWRRVVLVAAAMVAILGICAAIALKALADPDRMRRVAQEKAREAWSRDLAIGDISLLWLPLPALHATDVTLGDAPGGGEPWKLHAERVTVGLQILPLLIGRARPRSARVEGDLERGGRRLKVVASLDQISNYGGPDAVGHGKVDLDWGSTQLTASGRIPLQAQLRGAAFKAQLESKGLNDMLGFFDIERARATAPARASFEVRNNGERIEVNDVDAVLGKLKVTGDARIATGGAKPVIDVRVQAERLDWPQALLDAGEAPVAPLPPDQILYDRPIAWPLLVGLEGKQGAIEAWLGSLRLRNGVELTQAKADMTFEGDTLDVKGSANLLGGSTRGTLHFEGRKKAVRVNLEGTNLLLERWFKERRSDVKFTGGPMAITARLAGTGNSLRDLSRTMTGPVAIRMGPGVYVSEKAGNAEARMVAFSKKDAKGGIAFECASAELPFAQGRADGDGIVGARSALSRLLTSGYVSMRDVAVDLRGRLLQKPGAGVGFSAIAKDLRISGNIRQMHVSLDPAGKPAAAARAGAAIATLGLSLAGSAAKNAARVDIDPCAAVFGTPRK
jgi:AsmA family protein